MIERTAFSDRLGELAELLVQALEELEAGRQGAAVEALMHAGDRVLALLALEERQRRLHTRLTKAVIRLLYLGEEREA